MVGPFYCGVLLGLLDGIISVERLSVFNGTEFIGFNDEFITTVLVIEFIGLLSYYFFVVIISLSHVYLKGAKIKVSLTILKNSFFYIKKLKNSNIILKIILSKVAALFFLIFVSYFFEAFRFVLDYLIVNIENPLLNSFLGSDLKNLIVDNLDNIKNVRDCLDCCINYLNLIVFNRIDFLKNLLVVCLVNVDFYIYSFFISFDLFLKLFIEDIKTMIKNFINKLKDPRFTVSAVGAASLNNDDFVNTVLDEHKNNNAAGLDSSLDSVNDSLRGPLAKPTDMINRKGLIKSIQHYRSEYITTNTNVANLQGYEKIKHDIANGMIATYVERVLNSIW